MLLDDFRGGRLQDRIGMIADQLYGAADERGVRGRQAPAIDVNGLAPPRLVHDRAGTRQRWFDPIEIWVAPNAGEVRDRCRALASLLCERRGREECRG